MPNLKQPRVVVIQLLLRVSYCKERRPCWCDSSSRKKPPRLLSLQLMLHCWRLRSDNSFAPYVLPDTYLFVCFDCHHTSDSTADWHMCCSMHTRITELQTRITELKTSSDAFTNKCQQRLPIFADAVSACIISVVHWCPQ